MVIDIQNFNSIKTLHYEISDSKINFLFGISGSGKSSIAYALTDSNKEKYQMVGKEAGLVKVKVNESDIKYTDNYIYNSKFMEGILINKQDGQDVYTILIGSGGKIAQCSQKYQNAISDLIKVKDELLNSIGKINDLKSTLKIDYTKKGDLKSSCLIKKMAKSAGDTLHYKNISNYSLSEIKWVLEGTKMQSYQIGKCPFCSKKLSESRKKKIKALYSFDDKTFEKLKSKQSILDSIGLEMPEWNKPKQVSNFLSHLKEYIDILPELSNYYSYLDILNKKNFTEDTPQLTKPSLKLRRLFPKIYDPVMIFNEKAAEIKKTLGELKLETKKVLNQNVELINHKLDLLGIPYIFEREQINSEEKTASFILKHKNDIRDKIDMSRNLSSGEKNLIGLLLFLLSHTNSKFLIIDDPASSFDEYRRKIIFDFIYEFHKKSTVLVLSHDHVFAKLATFHNKWAKDNLAQRKILPQLDIKFANETGKISFLENYTLPKIKEITSEDFGPISKFVIERVKDLGQEMNYIVALNLRLHYELEKTRGTRSIVYSYLSAILHKVPYETIIEKLKEKNKSEQDILNIIQKDTDMSFRPLSNEYINRIDCFNYCDFEKTIKKREELPLSRKNREIKEELNNIVHLNLAYATMLNPYKFNYFSKFIFNLISNS